MKKYLVEYLSNNSGGSWWLKDKDWYALEKVGWRIFWYNKSPDYKDGNYQYDREGLPKFKNIPYGFSQKDKKGDYRRFGALAKYAFKRFDTIKEALEEFEKITGQNVSDEGCNCCGAPHCFSWKNKGRKYVDSCSGEGCLKYLYDCVPQNLREATEKLNKRREK